MEKRVIAFIYDFDGTLSPGNMQEYDFLRILGIDNSEMFWGKVKSERQEQNASEILTYMKVMLDESNARGEKISRQAFVDYGRSVELYPGVREWFDLINQEAAKYDITVEHYVNSSGLQEIIEGTEIANAFTEIYACRYMYDENANANWPAVAVDFTEKTQILYMINKGIKKISDNQMINASMPDEEKRIPFSHMVYFGDGETDIPCMKLLAQEGGYSIAIYKENNKSKIEKAIKYIDRKAVTFACPADYSKDKDIYNCVCAILERIVSNDNFYLSQQANRQQLIAKKEQQETEHPVVDAVVNKQ